MNKGSFVLYAEYLENIELLSMEQRGVLITALMKYVSGLDIPDMDAVTRRANVIVGIIKVAGVVVSVISLMLIGIKYVIYLK